MLILENSCDEPYRKPKDKSINFSKEHDFTKMGLPKMIELRKTSFVRNLSYPPIYNNSVQEKSETSLSHMQIELTSSSNDTNKIRNLDSQPTVSSNSGFFRPCDA